MPWQPGSKFQPLCAAALMFPPPNLCRILAEVLKLDGTNQESTKARAMLGA
jgi:hypothetical protein